MTIELRLSDVDPPAPEPKRTIYRDIVNLPNPVLLGITIRYFNYDDVGLYFQITGSAAGYTFGTVNLGLLASGANAYINLDQFASRAKPAGETTENITLTLRAYTDAGYSVLKWTYDRVVSVVFINSADPSYTVDVLNNFDDGTVQGWVFTNEAGGANPTLAVAVDYTLSPPYSLKLSRTDLVTGNDARDRISKSFTTANRNYVYAIADIRVANSGAANVWPKNVKIGQGAVVLIFLGKPYDTVGTIYIVLNKWMRVVVPLPKDTAVDFRIILESYITNAPRTHYLWLDDFKVISKN